MSARLYDYLGEEECDKNMDIFLSCMEAAGSSLFFFFFFFFFFFTPFITKTNSPSSLLFLRRGARKWFCCCQIDCIVSTCVVGKNDIIAFNLSRALDKSCCDHSREPI